MAFNPFHTKYDIPQNNFINNENTEYYVAARVQ